MAKAIVLTSFLLLLLLSQRVDSGSIVRNLPGFEGPLPFELETGYVGVGEGEEVQLFYYFIKSERNPQEDPLLVWLNGGPGCSSLNGLVYLMGPLAFKLEEYNGSLPSLVSTSYSWTKFASIIFLDQPVGTGFSYARNQLVDTPSDTSATEHVYQFVQKFLLEHPEFVSNPFYIGGDSYAGKVVPAMVQRISKGNEEAFKPLINLQGYALGNPATDINFDTNYKVSFAHGMGLISDELYESLERSCGGNYVTPSNGECVNLLQDYNKCVERIYDENILIPWCDISPKPFQSDSSHRQYLRSILDENNSVPTVECYGYRRLLSTYWANDESVRNALNVVKGSIGEWVRCKWGMPYVMDIKSSIPYHVNNSIKGYRSLVFSGDHDLLVPFLGTQAWIRSLNYSIVDKWRPWMINDQVAGYTKTYANKMTFATVKSSGHTTEYKPDESSVMFERWISGMPL